MSIILELPEELSERRAVLETELKLVVAELCFTGLRKELNELFVQYKLDPMAAKVEWEFNGKSDDGGGTTYYVTGLYITDENGEEIVQEDKTMIRKSKYSEDFYDYDLHEDLYDIISDYRTDLYDHDITEIIL